MSFYQYFDSLAYTGWYENVLNFYDKSYLAYVKVGDVHLLFGSVLDLTGPEFENIEGHFGDDLGVNWTYSIQENLSLQIDVGCDLDFSCFMKNPSAGIYLNYNY
mgnify:CR=1 FL=1